MWVPQGYWEANPHRIKIINIQQTGYLEWDPKETPNPMPTPAVFNYLRDETARAWNKYVQTDEYKANPLREGNGDLVNFVPSTAFTDPNTVLNQ